MFQVHIQPMTGPILGHREEQKPLVAVPTKDDTVVQKTEVDTQVLKLSCLRFPAIFCTFSE
jgi:hypothetical protein